MKALYASVLAVLVMVTIVGILGTQQIYAPRTCGSCSEFKKLTNEFEKEVIDVAIGNPELIPELVHDYSDTVLDLFRTPSTSP